MLRSDGGCGPANRLKHWPPQLPESALSAIHLAAACQPHFFLLPALGLGFARGLPLTALHRFQPIGVAGLVINIITGIGFVASDPLPYLMNGAFRLKLLLMLVAGLNILIFYFVLPREARQLQTNASAPIAARLVAAASLLLWLGVIWAGRFIAFTGKNTL